MCVCVQYMWSCSHRHHLSRSDEGCMGSTWFGSSKYAPSAAAISPGEAHDTLSILKCIYLSIFARSKVLTAVTSWSRQTHTSSLTRWLHPERKEQSVCKTIELAKHSTWRFHSLIMYTSGIHILILMIGCIHAKFSGWICDNEQRTSEPVSRRTNLQNQ